MALSAARRFKPRHRREAGSLEASEGFGDAKDDLAVDELLLASSGLAQCGGGEPVDLAQSALRQLVKGAEGPGGNNGSRLMSDGNSPAVSRALAARWLWWTKFALDTCC